MNTAFRTNPMLSLWLSGANAWAGAAHGFWVAELQRQQTAFMTEAARQAMLFWTGAFLPAAARTEAAAPSIPTPENGPEPAKPLPALRVIERQFTTPPETGPEPEAAAPALSVPAPAAEAAPPPEPEARPVPETGQRGGRALASRAERRSTPRPSGKAGKHGKHRPH